MRPRSEGSLAVGAGGRGRSGNRGNAGEWDAGWDTVAPMRGETVPKMRGIAGGEG